MIKVCFSTPFTGKGLYGGFRGQDWYDTREELFRKYTIPGLKNQSDKDFFWWLQFRPEEKDNPTTAKILQDLAESGLQFGVTFHGIAMADDRAIEHNDDLVERTQVSLDEMKDRVGKSDVVYEVNLDSDDLPHENFVSNIKEIPFTEHGATYCRNGFAYQPYQKRLAEWNNPISQQNYTVMYPSEIFWNSQQHFKYQRGLKTHEEIPELFNATELPSGMYLTLIHGKNISTIWGHPFMGKEYYDEQTKKNILRHYGVS